MSNKEEERIRKRKERNEYEELEKGREKDLSYPTGIGGDFLDQLQISCINRR